MAAQRDSRGRFLPGNKYASKGGRARARSLSPERRRQIARQGFAALVRKRFDGDPQAAGVWIGMVGVWAQEAAAYGNSPIYIPNPHPGSPEKFMERWPQRKRAEQSLKAPPPWLEDIAITFEDVDPIAF